MPLRRLLLAVVLLVLVGMAWRWGVILTGVFEDDVLCVNYNTLRDFEVYGRVRHGELPLQGPITSVGGNHGWLAYWIFGLAVTAWPSVTTTMLVSMALVALGWGLGVLLAWRLAPGVPTALAALVLLSTHMPILTSFPSHIVLLLPGTALALLGATWSREHAWGAVLATTGLAVAMGGHRVGWVLFALLFLMDRAHDLNLFRRRIAWLPLGLYVIPSLVVHALGGSPTPGSEDRTSRWLELVSPWHVAVSLPFARPFYPGTGALELVQMAFVLAVLALAWRALDTPAAKATWWLYVVLAAGLLLLPEDGQYYMPLVALLPALVALATQAVMRLGAAPLAGWTAAATLVLGASHFALATDMRSQLGGVRGGFRSITEELALVRALGEQHISRDELWTRTHHDRPHREQAMAYLAAVELDLPPRSDGDARCFESAPTAQVAGQPGWAPAGTSTLWSLRVREGATDCTPSLERVESPIWYLDLTTLRPVVH
ncbi:MAG: hypothetical protein H6732_10870 [Alphaproteobacteria bacterium]|nr:hypothetical protein [Alphaproteobacteria bacterium]